MPRFEDDQMFPFPSDLICQPKLPDDTYNLAADLKFVLPLIKKMKKGDRLPMWPIKSTRVKMEKKEQQEGTDSDSSDSDREMLNSSRRRLTANMIEQKLKTKLYRLISDREPIPRCAIL